MSVTGLTRPFLLLWIACTALSFKATVGQELHFTLHYQQETSTGSGRYHRLQREEVWSPKETALIVCDMWDLHTCHRAVLRLKELAPRLEQVLQAARQRGVTIIHAPSSCMDTYQGHPARERTLQTPRAENFPKDIQLWCHKIPREEQGIYPIDQSAGGADDDPEEHSAWSEELKRLQRNPNAPWKSQIDVLSIDPTKDYISDRGEEVWSILESKNIKHVILTGVHTNMCVLGRPFGLRRMVEAGKSTVLMSDMTDTMYDPRCSPFVSHFTGTDLIVDHIERHVCPTITSDQLLGGKPFRFSGDMRPTVAILMAEDEYKTETTLPPWSISHLGQQCRLRWIFGSDSDRHDIPGIEAVNEADLLIVSVRRRPLPAKQLEVIRQFVQAGKPMLGVRTASHAFSLRQPSPPVSGDRLDQWPQFDQQVWGGNYQGHHGNGFYPAITAIDDRHPIFAEWGTGKNFVTRGSLYKVSPLAKGTVPLAMGTIEGQPAEPVAWTFLRDDGGKSFYTSLGHADDFDSNDPRFSKMLARAVFWLLSPHNGK